MLISSQGFHTPKRGNAANEYEDAFFPEQSCERRKTTEFHCAVADGASDSAFSREWARLLVRWYHYRLFSLGLVHRCWQRKVNERPVPWYLEEKIRRGAHATLVGLTIRDSDESESLGGGVWEATAIGDSCLFHVRGDELLTVAPMKRSRDFNNHPHLVSTNSNAFGLNDTRLKIAKGNWQPSDVFYLQTDALAEWTLSQHERGKSPWSLFRSIGKDGDSGTDSFEALVANLREHGGLHNDDTTMLRIEVS